MITGKQYCEMVISGCNHISNQKAAINALNVFPVPDGDTGTNMSLTISAAARELQNMGDCTVAQASDRAAGAMLKGARGNSGVILSLLFRGISKGLKEKETATAADFSEALHLGVKAAYRAVMKPTEGTVLTVSRVAAENLSAYLEKAPEATAEQALAYYVEQANEVLQQTPEMLPQLKQAGVVDAGGKGFAVVMEGMLSALRGQFIEPQEAPEAVTDTVVDEMPMREEDITFTYCTEYIVTVDETAKKDNPADLRSYLESIGDSVVCVPDNDIIKVHVHTNHPGRAIEEALRYGSLVNLKIDNMKEEFRARQKSAPAEPENALAEPTKKYGFVSVVAGSGLAAVCKDLGVDTVVEGGQTMNPSTADILAAVNRTPSEVVFVLPNNKNIIMAAEQAKELSTAKEVVVIPSKTVPQGITAMLGFDETLETEALAEAMTAMLETVKTAQVTYAARDSVFDEKEIKEGQLLGLMETKVTFVEDQMEDVVRKLFEELGKDGGSYINVYYGEDVTEEQAEAITAQIQAQMPEAEVMMLPGGQPVYHYIFSVE
ncbi:MAG: DAK2 domain-containing protein [Clostridia bacterium]|nr:DAK2 domain-containing protein [Clostridia bacterium]